MPHFREWRVTLRSRKEEEEEGAEPCPLQRPPRRHNNAARTTTTRTHTNLYTLFPVFLARTIKRKASSPTLPHHLLGSGQQQQPPAVALLTPAEARLGGVYAGRRHPQGSKTQPLVPWAAPHAVRQPRSLVAPAEHPPGPSGPAHSGVGVLARGVAG